MSLVNPRGQILYVSPSSTAALGFKPAEFLGRRALDLVHPDDRRHSRRALRMALANPEVPHVIEVRILRKDGEWRRVATKLFNLPQIGAIVINCYEIGASHTELDSARAPFDELERQVAKSEGPLSSITPDVIEPEPCGPVDLEDVLFEVLSDLHPAVSSCDVRMTWDPLPLVHANARSMATVLRNLISNSIKFRNSSPLRIHISAEPSKAAFVIKVKDNGTGIDPQHHASIFHPSPAPLSGLGLALCKKIVEDAGGMIWVESLPGHGSTFCFTIAKAWEAASPPRLRN